MKYKLIGVLACITVLAVAMMTLVFSCAEETKRFHQHREAAAKTPCEHTDGTFCTHLPLVQIETDGKEIPGEAILDENRKILGYTTAEDGSDFITASLSVTDSETEHNHVSDSPTLQSKMQIHVRGNSSRRFDKVGYSIRLTKADGTENAQSVMGMDVHHEWVLHGPYLDKTLIRNYMWYNIAGEIMDYAPNVRFCEVMINGEYRGVYVMTESIAAGQDGARLNLKINKKDNTFTGYLLRLDRGSTTEAKNLNVFSMYTYRTQNILNLEYPGTSNITPELARSIELDFTSFEKALYSYDYDSREYGYPSQIDAQNFADYFLLNEITCNYDAGAFSTYIYKDIDGIYKMCIWDFNSACDNYQEQSVETEGFGLQSRLWFDMLLKSEAFTELCIDRYRELRETYFSNEYLEAYIDETVSYLGPAIDRNFEKWGHSFEQELLAPWDRNHISFEEAVAQLREFLKERTAFLDENIETLRQYSAASKIKKFSEGTE